MQQPDFQYYTLEAFLNNEDISQSKSMPLFSTIHFNIRSLSANHDGLTMLLSDLQHSFNLIGLSETKMKSNCDLTSKIAIEGYDFVSRPTVTNAGGKPTFSSTPTQLRPPRKTMASNPRRTLR